MPNNHSDTVKKCFKAHDNDFKNSIRFNIFVICHRKNNYFLWYDYQNVYEEIPLKKPCSLNGAEVSRSF